MTVDARQWSALDLAAAEAFARTIDAELIKIYQHTYAGRSAPVALFTVDAMPFTFVPGGEVTVGFDGSRFAPTDEQVADYAESALEYGIESDIREYVDEMTSPVRTVEVPSLLVAVDSIEAGAVEVEPDHPHIVRLVEQTRDRPPLATQGLPQQIEWHQSGRAVLTADWTVERAWLLDTPSWDAEVGRLAAAGQRLPTPEEWEHACGAGARSLFRWGDVNPGSDPWSATTGPHREPNLFGLTIAQDPYREERTSVRAVVVGGDGGTAVCGGVGSFLSWLTIATAYRDADYAAEVAGDDEFGTMRVRPVIQLG